mmetsp:Transcript_7031/g.14625  ORF Transcript_7031/g.14625 Transcript_7031/m.14625 type:complete len:318 (+) Transcript_7031:687-1640(+)
MVVQNITRSVTELEKDQVLDVLELLLHPRVSDHQGVLLLGHLRHLLLDDDSKELVLKSAEGNGEIEQTNLDADLGGVVRIRHLRSHEEPEAVVPRDGAVADLNHFRSALLELLLQQERLQTGIQSFPDVLQQNPTPEPNTVLESPQEVLVCELDDVNTVLTHREIVAHVLDELVGLALRVDEEGIPPSLALDDTVLDTVVVGRKAGKHPRPNLDWLGQSLLDVTIGAVGQVQSQEVFSPLVVEVLPEIRGERARICDRSGTDKTVSYQVIVRDFESCTTLGPTRPLASQAADELLSPDEPRATLLNVISEFLFLVVV